MVTDRDVREIVATLLEVDVADVGLDSSFFAELDMSSLHKAELIASLEDTCGTELSPADAADLDTVRDVMRLLRDRRLVP